MNNRQLSPDATGGSSGGPLPNSFGFSKLSGENPNAMKSSGLAIAPPQKRRKPTERKLNISELLKVMYRGRWIILGTFAVVFAYTVYTTYEKPYVYGSGTRMFIDRPPGGKQIESIVGGPAVEDHSIANEVQFFKSHIVSGHVARLLHEYATGNWHEVDSLFQEAYGSDRNVPPDPSQLSITRLNDNPKLPRRSGIADTNTLEARASAAVSVAADPSNDYLIVSSEAYTPLDAAFLANLYVAVFVKDNQTRVRQNSAALKSYLFEQKQRSFDTLRKVEIRLRDYLGTTSGMNAEDIAKNLTDQYEDLKQKRQAIEIESGCDG